MNPDRITDLRARATTGESKAVLAREFGISRDTVYSCLRAATDTTATT